MEAEGDVSVLPTGPEGRPALQTNPFLGFLVCFLSGDVNSEVVEFAPMLLEHSGKSEPAHTRSSFLFRFHHVACDQILLITRNVSGPVAHLWPVEQKQRLSSQMKPDVCLTHREIFE